LPFKVEKLDELIIKECIMIEKFKQWFREIEDKATKEKKAIARKKGDENAWKKEIWKSAEKNIAIKKKFKKEGKKIGYESRPYKIDNKVKGGWLYDFCWREFNKLNNLKNIILAMEIEMTQKDGSIKNDFNKLLQAEAKYKIMVFQRRKKKRGEDKDQFEHTLDMLEKAVKSYKSKSDTEYLLCGWNITEHIFKYSYIQVKNQRIKKIKRG
jgi:hypothetical protein